jgi:hypothetical protein
MAVSSRLERIVQFLDEAVVMADSFMTDDEPNCGGNDHHDVAASVLETVVRISNLPPLDQITICSESCSDNTSLGDVSSVTTEESDEMSHFFSTTSVPKRESSCPPSPSLRTIFDRYWEKHRPAEVVTTALESKTEPISPISHKEESSSINTYERTLHQSQEKGVASSVPKSLSRRRIFQGLLPPTPNLEDGSDRYRHPSKVHSDPCLLTKKAKPPCLRRSRFSVSTTTATSSSSYSSQPPSGIGRKSSSSSSVTSVTFNPKVDVVVFRRPVEHFASKGWSDYFAS